MNLKYPKDTLTVLAKAKEVIQKPESWCRDLSAMNENGKACWYGSEKAVAFCILGAISKGAMIVDLEEGSKHNVGTEVEGLFRATINSIWIGQWNDSPVRTHDDVLRAFDDCIEVAKQALENDKTI